MLGVGERPLRYAGPRRFRADQIDHLLIRLGLSRRIVAVPAAAGLLTQPAHLVQSVGDQWSPFPWRGEMFQLLANPPGDVDARHVVDGEHAHRHAEARERAIDLVGRRALFHHELGFVHVGKHHAVADEPRIVARQHADLPQSFGERECGRDRVVSGLPAAHDLEQPHHVRRTEEVQTDDVGRAGRWRRQSRRCRAWTYWCRGPRLAAPPGPAPRKSVVSGRGSRTPLR